jgi:uncharacterized protein YjbI with pentapeptide repeats
MPTDSSLPALMVSGEVMGKHREPVELEQEPGNKSAAEGEPSKPHWGSKLWEWTGFGEKKLWDWLQLLSALAIPIVLTVAGFWFTSQQARHQQDIEERRAKAEQLLEEQRAQDTALQAYLDQMGALILEENLRNSEGRREVRTLARARTLTVLGRLDPERKRSAVQFLYESSLIDKADPIVDLSNADLRSVDLRLKELIKTDLNEVDLSKANLSNAHLDDASLINADLSDASLINADLSDASLINADLDGANLSSADLSRANLTYATLNRTNLCSAILSGADLNGASLIRADLSHADLRGAQGVDKGTLKAQYVKLKGTTMPDGTKTTNGQHGTTDCSGTPVQTAATLVPEVMRSRHEKVDQSPPSTAVDSVSAPNMATNSAGVPHGS